MNRQVALIHTFLWVVIVACVGGTTTTSILRAYNSGSSTDIGASFVLSILLLVCVGMLRSAYMEYREYCDM